MRKDETLELVGLLAALGAGIPSPPGRSANPRIPSCNTKKRASKLARASRKANRRKR